MALRQVFKRPFIACLPAGGLHRTNGTLDRTRLVRLFSTRDESQGPPPETMRNLRQKLKEHSKQRKVTKPKQVKQQGNGKESTSAHLSKTISKLETVDEVLLLMQDHYFPTMQDKPNSSVKTWTVDNKRGEFDSVVLNSLLWQLAHLPTRSGLSQEMILKSKTVEIVLGLAKSYPFQEARDITQASAGLARLEARTDGSLDTVGVAFHLVECSKQCLSVMTQQELATFIANLSKVLPELLDNSFWTLVDSRAQSFQDEFRLENLSRFLWGCNSLGHVLSPELWMPATIKHMETADVRSISVLMHGLAKAKEELPEEFWNHFEKTMIHKVDECSPRELNMMLRAMGVLDHAPSQWFASGIKTAGLELFPLFQPHDFVYLLRAMSYLPNFVDNIFWKYFQEAFVDSGSTLKGSDLLILVKTLERIGMPCSTPFLFHIEHVLLPKVPQGLQVTCHEYLRPLKFTDQRL